MFLSKSPVIFLAALLLSLSLRVLANDICTVKECSKDSKDTEIRCFRGVAKEDGKKKLTDNALLRTFMRSNPSGSLECFRQQMAAADNDEIHDEKRKKIREEIKSLSAFSGVIGGDVKPDNVDIVMIKGDWQIGLIDLDDGGWGSLLGDVFHTLAYNEVWEPRLTFDEAISAYLAGLKREELIGVSSLKDILGKPPSPEQSCDKLEKQWANDFTGKKVSIVKQGPANVRDWYAKDRHTFDKEIQNMGKSKHRSNYEGFEMKTESGGSMCMPRFVYLVDNGQKLCDKVQFKLQRLPAAAIFSGGESDHEKRLASLIEYYRPSGDIGHLVKADPVRGESNGYYIARYDRNENFKATSKVRLNSEQFAERHAYSKRMLHWLGQVHAHQNPDYAKNFEEMFQTNSENRDELKNMIDSHIAYMEKQASKLPPYKCGQ